MKYVILCIAMLCCFAFAGAGHSVASPGLDSVDVSVETAAADADAVENTGTCGGNICGKGTYCCNASCGICVPKGMLCTQQACAAETD